MACSRAGGRKRSSTACARKVRLSSMNLPRPAACCARRSKKPGRTGHARPGDVGQFAGLRALLVPSDRRRPFAGGTRRRRVVSFGMEDAGRWALTRRSALEATEPQADQPRSNTWRARCCDATASCSGVCSRARPTGCRHGGTCCACIADLRRAEKSVAAVSSPASPGEQYALPDAVGLLREMRRRPASGEWVSLSGADPLNLAGILTPGAKLAALTGNRLLFRDGVPVAVSDWRRGAVSHRSRCAHSMAGAQDAAAFRHAGTACRSGMTSELWSGPVSGCVPTPWQE